MFGSTPTISASVVTYLLVLIALVVTLKISP